MFRKNRVRIKFLEVSQNLKFSDLFFCTTNASRIFGGTHATYSKIHQQPSRQSRVIEFNLILATSPDGRPDSTNVNRSVTMSHWHNRRWQGWGQLISRPLRVGGGPRGKYNTTRHDERDPTDTMHQPFSLPVATLTIFTGLDKCKTLCQESHSKPTAEEKLQKLQKVYPQFVSIINVITWLERSPRTLQESSFKSFFLCLYTHLVSSWMYFLSTKIYQIKQKSLKIISRRT